MKLCTQYYRPPFPDRARWREDLAQIRATGLDAIVLTASWAWIEPEPGVYDFGDFDELIELADAAGLQVVLNTWSELQPVWIHRVVPDGHMVDHMGNAVISSPLAYAQFGILPGGCTDHPDVRERAGRFLTATAERYAGASNLLQWDCWNEIRWMTQSDGHVCHCAHTVARFRDWLRSRYGDLDGLNAAWRRRYRSWEDVVPAKLPTRTYSDAIAFQAFLSDRILGDLRWRRDAVRAGDASRPIVAHTAFPSAWNAGEFFEYEPALARGNDFELAAELDGFGSSYFPAWIHPSPADYGARLEATRSAVGDGVHWIAELQGGAAGHGLQAMQPVSGERQARWIWNGVARGVKGVAFWCWRDEVFGRESAGFGIVGDDGHREERLAALRRTSELFAAHGALLDAYAPDAARVGVVLAPDTYRLDWAGTLGGGLTASGSDPFQAAHAVQGCLRALERLQVPYDVVDPARAVAAASASGAAAAAPGAAAALDLSRYAALLLPWPLVVDPAFGERVLAWVRDGGTLLVEAELDAFTPTGLYRYGDERPFANALGLRGLGRRPLDGRPLAWTLDGARGELPAATWVEPQQAGDGAEVLASDERGATIVRRALGAGSVVSVGTHPATAYWHARDEGFERFLRTLLDGAGALPPLRCDRADGEVVQWRLGRAGGRALLFAINEGEAGEATFTGPAAALGPAAGGPAPPAGPAAAGPAPPAGPPAAARDLVTGAAIPLDRDGDAVAFRIPLAAGGHHVIAFGEEATR